jgi:hypothetical protein
MTLGQIRWPAGLVFDGGADDIELLRCTYLPGPFVEHLNAYLDLTKQIRTNSRTLYKVQVVESQIKNVIVPAQPDSDDGDILFYVNELYSGKDEPLNIAMSGFSRKVRGISKV